MAGTRVGEGIVAAWRDAGDADARRAGARLPPHVHRLRRHDGRRRAGGPAAGAGRGRHRGAPTASARPVDNFAGPGQGMKFPPSTGPAWCRRHRAGVDLADRRARRGRRCPTEVTTQQGRAHPRARSPTQAGGGRRPLRVAGPDQRLPLLHGHARRSTTAARYEGSFTLFGRRQGPLYRDLGEDVLAALLAGRQPGQRCRAAAHGLRRPTPHHRRDGRRAATVVAAAGRPRSSASSAPRSSGRRATPPSTPRAARPSWRSSAR